MRSLIAPLRIFVSGAWLSYIGLFAWAEPMHYIPGKIFNPLAQMLFFVTLGMAAINGVFGLTMVIGHERDNGTLIYLVGYPANRLATFGGRALFNILDGIFTVILCLGWGILLGLDLSHANMSALALTILVATVSSCGLGFLMGSLSLMSLNVMFINNTAYFLLLILCGANLPIAQMPGWMQPLSASVPLTRAIQSARLLVSGASLADALPLLAGELAVGLVYALAGFALFHWVESQARRRGMLEAF